MYENKSENIIQLFPLSIYKAKIVLTENERKILIKETENIENLITPIDKWMKF